MEVYLTGCLGFVFVEMMEFAVVLMLPEDGKNWTKESINKGYKTDGRTDNSYRNGSNEVLNQNKSSMASMDGVLSNDIFHPKMNQKTIDCISCLTMATTFILFNFIYWMYYLI